MSEHDEDTERRSPRWRGRLIAILFVVVVAAAATRAVRASPAKAENGGGGPETGTSFMPQGTGEAEAPPAEEEDRLDVILPYVTEGGLAMILGLFLGMATRSFLKLGFLLLVGGLVLFQLLVYKGILTIDWGAIKDLVLNITPDADWATVIREKLPSGGAFGLGYLLGLKKG